MKEHYANLLIVSLCQEKKLGKSSSIKLWFLNQVKFFCVSSKKVIIHFFTFHRYRRSNDEGDEESSSSDEEQENDQEDDNKDCDHHVEINAFGGNYTLCLYMRHFREEPILKNSYENLNISIFNNLNVSDDVSIEKFDLHFAVGHVIEGNILSWLKLQHEHMKVKIFFILKA